MSLPCADRSHLRRPSSLDERRQARVASTLRAAAYFPLFSVPNPKTATVPLVRPGSGGGLIGMKVYESLHRFAMQTVASPDGALASRNRVGPTAATIRIDWRVIPDDFDAAPSILPPSTLLDPSRPQRFAMYGGHFDWNDTQKSGFRGFGMGRTFPSEATFGTLHIGAIVDILQGYGRLKGLQGNAVVNGVITPPNDLALSVMVRMVDPAQRIPRMPAAASMKVYPSPDPEATFLTLIGEHDPDRPIVLHTDSDGHVTGADVYEMLRVARLDCDAGGVTGLAARIDSGRIAGTLQFHLNFDAQKPNVPASFTTEDAVFTFYSPRGDVVGTLQADVVEGRGFATRLPGAPQPVVRVVGFGPFQDGTGIFADVSGMLSLNGCISIPARTPSILYVLRVNDPAGWFRGWLR